MEAVKEVIEHLKKNIKEYKIDDKSSKKGNKGIDVFDQKRIKEEQERILESQVIKPQEPKEEGRRNLLEGIVNASERLWKATEERENDVIREVARSNTVYTSLPPPQGLEGDNSQRYQSERHDDRSHHQHYHSESEHKKMYHNH